jgi:hypothetical protein
MSKRILAALLPAAVLAIGASLAAQNVPEITFDSNADLLKTPNDVFVGEVGGVAANSKGQIYVYTRTGHPYATVADNRTFLRGGSRLFQFDPNGKFVRELGQDVYGFNAAIGLRIDPQDNVWTVDEVASQIVKFAPDGRILLVLGRKPEAINVRPAAGRGAAGAPGPRGNVPPPGGAPAAGGVPAAGTAPAAPAAAPAAGQGAPGGGRGVPGAGIPGSTFNRPTDVAWDKAGNIYIADGIGNNNRVAKFDKDGRFIRQWGSTGSGQGQFSGLKALAIDAQDNVYVADVGNKRIQVFDADGNFKREFTGVGTPLTMCMTRGATQYLYVSHSGDPDGMEDAAIYKVALDGRVLGRFGAAGKLPKQFGLANSLDCRDENVLLVGEMTNWRVQKLTLRQTQASR